MNLARIINHWENAGCDGHCDLCLYGESKDCTAEIKKDTKALIKAFKDLKAERDQLVKLKVVLLKDIEERDQMLEKKVEEIYPEFMKDYQAMKEELESTAAELEELKAPTMQIESIDKYPDDLQLLRCR